MESGSKGVVTVDEIEHLLVQLPGVTSARIVVNDWGAVEEIHILATDARNPKQVVRDVESSLAAKWGLYVDHKKISVAQLTGASGLLAPFRLKLIGVEMITDTVEGRVKGSVVLGRTDKEEAEYRGEAEGSLSKGATIRVFGEATVNAFNQLVDPGHQFGLEDVEILSMAGRSVALAMLNLRTPRGHQEILAGAAIVRVEPSEASVKAVLDAANRRMAKVVTKGRTISGSVREDST